MTLPLPLLDEKIKEFVLELVGQEDDLGLIHSLVRGLYAILPFPAIHFYQAKRDKQVHEEPGAPCWVVMNPMEPDRAARPIEAIPGLGQSLEARDMVYFQHPGTSELWVIHPIVQGELVSFLTLRCDDYTPQIQTLVEFFLVLYARQAGMVHKKERDVLTGLLNRQSFDERITKVLYAVDGSYKRSGDHNHGASLGIMDIDHFKRVNDTYGHLIGDEVLVLFSRLMDETFRHSDYLFRFGGEEFVVVLTDVGVHQAAAALERFRVKVENYPFPQVGRVTVSIGGVVIGPGDVPTLLYERADQALYYAKNHGRNQLRFHHELVALGEVKDEDHTPGEIELWG